MIELLSKRKVLVTSLCEGGSWVNIPDKNQRQFQLKTASDSSFKTTNQSRQNPPVTPTVSFSQWRFYTANIPTWQFGHSKYLLVNKVPTATHISKLYFKGEFETKAGIENKDLIKYSIGFADPLADVQRIYSYKGQALNLHHAILMFSKMCKKPHFMSVVLHRLRLQFPLTFKRIYFLSP